jgi:hypothetical protein
MFVPTIARDCQATRWVVSESSSVLALHEMVSSFVTRTEIVNAGISVASEFPAAVSSVRHVNGRKLTRSGSTCADDLLQEIGGPDLNDLASSANVCYRPPMLIAASKVDRN